MNKIECPVCGASDIQSSRISKIMTVPYGSGVQYSESSVKCLSCGASGDFEATNDEIIENALKIACKQSIESMIANLHVRGISMAHFERALDLPQRTVARWKSGECSASGLALMRLVRTYPWLLEVADEQFDERIAATQLCLAAASAFNDAIKPARTAASLTRMPNCITVTFTATMDAHTPNSNKADLPFKVKQLPAESSSSFGQYVTQK